MRDERRFTNSANAVAEARRFTHDALEGVRRDIEEAVIVMVSELATNSVRHASSQFTVEIERDSSYVRVAVADEGPGRPTVKSPTAREPTGRGLRIVRALSDDWGIAPAARGRGKVVWFTMGLLPA